MLYGPSRDAVRRKLIDSCFNETDNRLRLSTEKAIGMEKQPTTVELSDSKLKRKFDCMSVVRMGPRNGDQQKKKPVVSNSLECSHYRPQTNPVQELQNSVDVSAWLATQQPLRSQTKRVTEPILCNEMPARTPLQPCQLNSVVSMSKRVMLKLRSSQPSSAEKQTIHMSSNKQSRENIETSSRQLSKRKSGINITSTLRRTASREKLGWLAPQNLMSSCAQKCLQAPSGRKLLLTESTIRGVTWDRIPTVSSNYITTVATEQ